MITEIDNIFNMLDEANEISTQMQGIELAKNIQHLSMFFQPIESKSLWYNCAKVLIQKTNEQLRPYLIPMMEWLQDMNWPGADLVYNRLLEFSFEEIRLQYEICLQMAQKKDDFSWYASLRTLKEEQEHGTEDGSLFQKSDN